MSAPRLVAVGTPATFRVQVARAADSEPDEIEWVPTVTAAEERLDSGDKRPDVFVLSPEIKDEDAFGIAEFCGRSSPATVVILVRDRQLNGLLPAAMRAGIREVVDLSRGSEELRDALARGLSWSINLRTVRPDENADPGQRGTVISVFSSKGGTGKTFLACNLAAAIAKRTGKETALVDLDLDMGDVFSYWGQEATNTVQDLMALRDTMDAASVKAMGTQLDDRIWGFGALPDPAAETVAGGVVGRTLRTIRNSFPYTVVDAAAEYTDQSLACFDSSDFICLISGLDVVGIKHLSKALETLTSIGLPQDRFKVVINRADSKVGLTPTDVERVLRLEVNALIPSSRLVPTSLNRGRPVYLESPRSEVTKSVDAFASELVRHIDEPDGSTNGHKRRRFVRT
jgi:pilus assembly protein CpaE